MAEEKFVVSIDLETKRQAEAVFTSFEMDLNTGISAYLAHVALTGAIPFPLAEERTFEQRMRDAVNAQILAQGKSKLPAALYDSEQNRPYIEYADGRRSYEFD
ncbi:MAG: hypothetical protein LBC41_11390 [Clostridiales bacterium]|nr:hypothetical protein [Clostridiales bacterium]MDR2751255.1 hypothetical protein [Clostridiales bacterium]